MPIITGYNTNVEHRGKVYHVQTENSGTDQPHVSTHVFADGGRIIATRKTKYDESSHRHAEPAEFIRCLIKVHHRSMVIALQSGKFDGKIDVTGAMTEKTGVEGPLDFDIVHTALRRARDRAATGSSSDEISDAMEQSASVTPISSRTVPPAEAARSSKDDDLDTLVLNEIATAARLWMTREQALTA